MNIDVGDLVGGKTNGELGLVVDKKMPNEGLSTSMHVKHMLDSYQKVYYVFFSSSGKDGPYHADDLLLHQQCHNSR